MYEGWLGVGSGLEGGNGGTKDLSWQLARLRLSTGVDFRSDDRHACFEGRIRRKEKTFAALDYANCSGTVSSST